MSIPAWLQEHIYTSCPYCGSDIVNNNQLTDRHCSNPCCPEHTAHKVVLLAKRFGIKNFGIASAREAVQMYNIKWHTQILSYWFPEKPEMYLHEIGELCYIKGHQKRWREYCEGHDNMTQVLAAPSTPYDIRAHAPLILFTEALCKVKARLQGRRMNVMLSGSFTGYRSRSDFIVDMNRKYGDVVQLVDVGKRKTDVAYLVKEAFATDHEKSAIAAAQGITVISPHELDLKLHAYHTYIHRKERVDEH